MENKKTELLVSQNENVSFEEMEQVEEFGAGMDYVSGFVAGATIVMTVAALT